MCYPLAMQIRAFLLALFPVLVCDHKICAFISCSKYAKAHADCSPSLNLMYFQGNYYTMCMCANLDPPACAHTANSEQQALIQFGHLVGVASFNIRADENIKQRISLLILANRQQNPNKLWNRDHVQCSPLTPQLVTILSE